MLLMGSIVIVLFVLIIVLAQYYCIKPLGLSIGERFLPIIPLCLMAWSVFSMLPVNCWATYLRCHKKEPLMLNSVVMGSLCCASTLIIGGFYGLYGMCLGYAFLRAVSLVWVYSVYRNKRSEWHEEY